MQEAIMSTYSVSTRWTTVRRGEAIPDNGAPQMDFSSPPEFQGEAGYWTPEHFLVAAVSSCFVTTFKAIADFSKFAFASLDVATEGILEKTDSGYRFTRIYVRPILVVASQAEFERGKRLLEKAEHACLISRSLSAEVKLEASVMTASQQKAAQAT
jgi:peroxiredoxin-like protein